jgi:hypothetical protein
MDQFFSVTSRAGQRYFDPLHKAGDEPATQLVQRLVITQ